MSGRGLIPCVIYIIFIIIIIVFFFFSYEAWIFRSLGRILVCDCQPKGGLPIVLQVRVGMALNTYHIKYVIALSLYRKEDFRVSALLCRAQYA